MSTHEQLDRHPTGSWDEPEKASNAPTDEDAIRALAHRETSELAIDGEPLPVLEAFQQFLEAERKRSRRRIIILSTAFSTVLLVVVISGIIMGASMLRPLHDNYRKMQSDMDAFNRATSRSKGKIDDMFERFGKQDRRLVEELARERQSVAETKEKLSNKTKQFEDDVARIHRLMGRLHAQNRELRKSIAEQNELIPALIAEASTPGHSVEPANAESPVGPLRSASSQVKGQPKRETLRLAIRPDGFESSVAWRIPIPE